MLMFEFKEVRRSINLEHLIMTDGPNDRSERMLVTVVPGVTFEAWGEDVDRLSGLIRKLATDPFPQPVSGVIRHEEPPEPSLGPLEVRA